MFDGKCAYCESYIKHIAYAHIEHYCPKSGLNGRPSLAFTWTNLLLACGVCNGAEYKGDRFPDANSGGPLLNPTRDDPAAHLDFVFDPRTKLATVVAKTPRGATTRDVLGLNRRDLWDHRSRFVTRMAFIASKAQIDPEAEQLLKESQADDAEYAAFTRKL